jgi:SAM-dependent methyltransferase
MSSPEAWFAEHVPGKSFVDVGGLWGVVGERVTVAAQHDATSLAMVDHTREHGLWDHFRKRLEAHGIKSSVRMISADVEHPDFAATVGRFDVVYCRGLLYHTPSPVQFLAQLREITNTCLILGSMVLAEAIAAKLNVAPGLPLSLFVPALDERQRQTVADAYNFPDHARALGVTEPWNDWIGPPNAVIPRHDAKPYWWLHRPAAIEAMLRIVGFDVRDRYAVWDGREILFLCAV